MLIYLIAAVLALAALYLVLSAFGGVVKTLTVWARPYLRFRSTRLVTCPETKEPAGVRLDARHAAVTAALGDPDLRLKECTRWPERRNCGQECLKQIEAAPEDCLVRNILTKWYQGKPCVYCGKPLGEINWLEHRPALMSPERNTVEWRQLRPETIPRVLATHLPVCWNCHIAETFRRQHPELVVDRDWKLSGKTRPPQGEARGEPIAQHPRSENEVI